MRGIIVAALLAAASASYAAAGTVGEKPAAGADLTRASRIVAEGVFTPQGERIGDVEDLLLDDTGRLQQLVIGLGGFFGIGERLVAVPFAAVRVKEFAPDLSRSGTAPPPIPPPAQPALTLGGAATGAMPGGGSGIDAARSRLVVDMTREQLRAAPEFRADEGASVRRP